MVDLTKEEVQNEKDRLEGDIFRLLGNFTESGLTLLEINDVLQRVSSKVAEDLVEVLTERYRPGK